MNLFLLSSHAAAAADINLLYPEQSVLSLKHITSVSRSPHAGGVIFLRLLEE